MAKDGKQYNLAQQVDKGFGTTRLIENAPHQNLSFSFLYFRQIDNFGIGNCSKEWFVGLLNRLSTFCQMSPKNLESASNKATRLHPINWKAKNIPIRRTDLNWLPQDILNNDESFPIMQLSISTGTGRIIGFFGVGTEASVFYIVLFDPNHNLQPSKRYNYQIQSTMVGISQYDCLLEKLLRTKAIVQECSSTCILLPHIDDMDKQHEHIIYFSLDDEFYQAYMQVSQERTLKEIIESGVLYFM